ncbi:MAG: DMT family transporter [Planctomycetes bacterium]|nr:DMT family transporter [Planctomycetota bacterium]
MLAFAGNSLLCREALGRRGMDPVSFTTLRVLSGAALLVVLARRLDPGARAGSVAGAAALFAYALAFSLAYVTLEAGVGALLLFGAVQATMLGAGLAVGERPSPVQWAGLLAALGGLVHLLLPGLAAPDPLGAALMLLAGVAWGAYSLLGRGAQRPIAATAGNFVRAAPLALAASLAALVWTTPRVPSDGALLAVASGAVTSGLGYSLWYLALRGHTATTAAVVQLSVPVLAAAGGVLLLGEAATSRLVVAGALVLGGVAAATLGRREARA